MPEASDETIDILPPAVKPRKKRTMEERVARKPKLVAKTRRPVRHPLLFGAEEHLRKIREVKNGEFLRPYMSNRFEPQPPFRVEV